MTDAPFVIGLAAVDITPPAGVTLTGYGTREGTAASVDHPLRAEALVCRGAGAAWALVTSDLIGFPRAFVERVRREVAADTDLAPEAVMVTGSHTHSAPAGMGTYGDQLNGLDIDYREGLVPRLAGLVGAAATAAAPGAFEVAWTAAPELGHNRRVVEAGRCRNEWEDLDGRHAGFFDPTVMLVGVRRPGGALDGLLVSYGCHPVTLGPANLAISPDYPGYAKDLLEAAGVGTALFCLSGAADINPRECIRVGAAVPRRMGERLGAIALEAVRGLEPVAAGPVAAATVPWSFARSRDGAEHATEVQGLRAGALGIAGIPGELFSRYTGRFRQASPLPATLVATMANDACGYLPLDAAYPEGGLEVMRAATAAVEGPLTEHVARALSALVAPAGVA